MMTELKPCPFCGGKAIIMDMGYPHWIYCDRCGAKVHGRTSEEKDSIEAWNRRAKERRLRRIMASARILAAEAIETAGIASRAIEELQKWEEEDDD